MKQFRIIVGILFIVLIVTFSVQNAGMVDVRFLSWGVEISLALLMLICISLGAIVSMFLLMPPFFKKKKTTVHSETQKTKSITPDRSSSTI